MDEQQFLAFWQVNKHRQMGIGSEKTAVVLVIKLLQK